jgi:branched-chain amino acid transport system permease protein
MEVSRIRSRAWVIAAGLSGATMIVGSMTAGATQVGTLGVETMVRILAAAVIARMVSFPVAVVSALTIGVFQNAVDWSFNAASLVDGILLGVIALAFALQRRHATRAERERDTAWRFGSEIRPTPAQMRMHPAVRAWRRNLLVVVFAAAIAVPWIMSPGQTTTATGAVLAALVGLSILVLTGWAGQISLGQVAFSAIGAYVAAVSRAPFPAAIVLGALAGAAAAVVVGFPALRLRGMQLAVTSLALALATSALVLDEHRLGRFLPSAIQRPHLLHDDKAFYEAALAILLVAVAGVRALRKSRFARALIAGRDNDQAAESYGIGLVRARLNAFALSGFLAALAGALLAYQQFGVQPASFAPEQSVRAFLWAVIGGLGAVSGPLLGALGRGVTDMFAANSIVQLLAAGLGGLLLLILAPGGLARVVFGARDAVLRRLAIRDRIVVPSLLADVRMEGERERAAIAARDGGTPLPRYRLEDQWALSAKEPSRG